MLVEHLEGYFVDFGESVVLGTSTATGIFDAPYADALGVAGREFSLLCIGTDVASVAVGSSATVRGTGFTVRGVLPEAPDGVMVRLFLERS